MIQPSRGFIINDYDGLKKQMNSSKPKLASTMKRVSKSISNLDSEKMRKIYMAK